MKVEKLKKIQQKKKQQQENVRTFTRKEQRKGKVAMFPLNLKWVKNFIVVNIKHQLQM